jgi:hypothetical protein
MFLYAFLFPFSFVFIGLILFYHSDLFQVYNIPPILTKIGTIISFVLSIIFLLFLPIISLFWYPYEVVITNKKIVLRYRFHDKSIDMDFDYYMEQSLMKEEKDLHLIKNGKVEHTLTNIDDRIIDRIKELYFDKSQSISVDDFNKIKKKDVIR